MQIKASPDRHLLRVLGLGFGLSVSVGAMIGAGILRAPGSVLNHLPSAPLALALWTFGCLHAFLGANVVSEVTTAVPKSGGLFVPAREAFGDSAGLLIGWSDWLNMVASTAALAIAAGEFCALLSPQLHGHEALVGALLTLAFFVLNWLGVREGSAAQIAGSAAKGLVLIVVVVLILALPYMPLPQAAAHGSPATPVTLVGCLVAYQLIFGVYSGWPNAAYFAEEDKAPGRNIPRSMFLSVIAVGALYLSINLTLLHAVPVRLLREADLPIALALSGTLGAAGLKLVAAGAVLIVLGCLNANMMVGPRILYGLARDGLFPRFATHVNRGGTPGLALVASTALALALTFTGTFETIFLLMGALAVVPLILTDASLFKLRLSKPDLPRPYRARLYPWLPALALLLDLGLLASFLWSDPLSGVSVVAALLMCIPIAFFVARAKARGTPSLQPAEASSGA